MRLDWGCAGSEQAGGRLLGIVGGLSQWAGNVGPGHHQHRGAVPAGQRNPFQDLLLPPLLRPVQQDGAHLRSFLLHWLCSEGICQGGPPPLPIPAPLERARGCADGYDFRVCLRRSSFSHFRSGTVAVFMSIFSESACDVICGHVNPFEVLSPVVLGISLLP